MKDSTTADAGRQETRASGRPDAAGPEFHDRSRSRPAQSRLVLPAAMVLSGIVSVQAGAALVGLALLGQHLSVAEWLAIACVMIAYAGAAQH